MRVSMPQEILSHFVCFQECIRVSESLRVQVQDLSKTMNDSYMEVKSGLKSNRKSLLRIIKAPATRDSYGTYKKVRCYFFCIYAKEFDLFVVYLMH